MPEFVYKVILPPSYACVCHEVVCLKPSIQRDAKLVKCCNILVKSSLFPQSAIWGHVRPLVLLNIAPGPTLQSTSHNFCCQVVSCILYLPKYIYIICFIIGRTLLLTCQYSLEIYCKCRCFAHPTKWVKTIRFF